MLKAAASFKPTAVQVAAAIFIFALLLRLILAFQWQATPYGPAPLLDAKGYHEWAIEITHGKWLRTTAFYQSPLYPYFLGLFYALFGASPLVAALINSILMAGFCAVMAHLTCRMFNCQSGLLAGLIAATNLQLLFYSAPIMKEPLALFLLALYLSFLFNLFSHKSIMNVFMCGLTLGLCALARGNVAIVGLAAPILFACHMRKNAIKYSGLFFAALMLAIAPVTLHNFIVGKDFVPLTYNEGFNLYIGNSPTAMGDTYSFPPDISSDVQEELDVTWVAQRNTGRAIGPSGVSSYWRSRALDYIFTHPARFFELLVTKATALWNIQESYDNYDLPFIRKNFSTLLSFPWPSFWLIALLLPIGLWAAWPTQRKEIAILLSGAALYAASLLIYYVTDRYRLPLLVFFIPLAGASAMAVPKILKSRLDQLVPIGITAFISLGLNLLPLRPADDLTAFDWGTLAGLHNEQEKFPEALAAFEKGHALAPEKLAAGSFADAAIAAESLNDTARAEKLLAEGLRLNPRQGVLIYNMGRIKAARGDLAGAANDLQKAIEIAPAYALSYYGLAKIYQQQGNNAKAREVILRGLAITPNDRYLRDEAASLGIKPQ